MIKETKLSFSNWEATTNGNTMSQCEENKDFRCTLAKDPETGQMRAILSGKVQDVKSRLITLIEKPPTVEGKKASYGTKRKGPSGVEYIFLRGQKSQSSEAFKANLFFSNPVDRLVIQIEETKSEEESTEAAEEGEDVTIS